MLLESAWLNRAAFFCLLCLIFSSYTPNVMAQPLEAFQLELETSGESELKTRFNIAELPLTSPQGRERAIDHIIESLNELHEKGIKAEVVIVDGTDTLLSEPNAKAKFLKKMGWRNAHHIPVEDYKNQDLQLSEYRELIFR